MRGRAAPFDTSFVAGVYDRWASVYDLVFGVPLHHGRTTALRRMNIRPHDHILELGVGTGLGLVLYPSDCSVTAVDLSASMLERARARVMRHRLNQVRLLQMDAARLSFPDDSFDIVYAPYFVSCVPDPVTVAREMRRVCRRDGRLVFLNHFRSSGAIMSRLERTIAPLALHLGFKSDLDLTTFLAGARLHAASIEKVNVPPIWSLLICPNQHLDT